ncbi:Vancomycin resistance protein YoaR, contains peptidoglycan-binding and VanW domains [Paenibacillus catalpae]|uniref:Vancomycin resistance protein YoaR, contains peptidoglycan-binding and VanW domains n=1 Tax=Paenibacillus catalpae TaxID=1045775 RepID=A0A1I1VT65_9BACL|nr:VanW family protein [Paenibacillus catalpae]SFD83750.1 Vancomycin resistance protein YoaR, contains peptidoglycan-binding and VanW domains [Paenibacillus catalpae]
MGLNGIWIASLAILLQQPVQPVQPEQPQLLSEQLTIEHRGQPLAHIERQEYGLPGTSFLDIGKFNKLQAKLEQQINVPPVNAYIGDRGNIVPEKTGYQLDRDQFATQFYGYFFNNQPSTIALPLTPIHAKVDSELLASIKEKAIGHYVTYYNSSNKNRSLNISLAAKAISNTVVFPGETFSFNRTVGPRTVEKGYTSAAVIVRGELSEGVGGGICQVSSTLFNAIDNAGLKIIQRYSHSRHVPYVLPGRDATVSWDGPDFVFRNEYNQPILIRAFAGSGRVFVSVYSSELIEYKRRDIPSMSKKLPEEIAFRSQQHDFIDEGKALQR